MIEKRIEDLIAAGRRDVSDPIELEALRESVMGIVSEHRRSYNSASVAVYLLAKYKFYEREGKSLREYLLSCGYSKGTISHMQMFGEFIVEVGFSPAQIPPESLVRSILTKGTKAHRAKLYETACKKHRQATGSMPGSGKATSSRRTLAEEVRDNVVADPLRGSENDGEDGDDDDGIEEAEVKHSADRPVEPPKSGDAVSTGVFLTPEQCPADDLLDYTPTRAEIKEVLNDFRRNDPDNIYLPSIEKSMSRGGDFTSAVLEKFKGKLKTVSLLRRVVRDFKAAGGKLTTEDITATKEFCEAIHAREDEQLQNAIDGEPYTNDDDSAEENSEGSGEEEE